MNRRRGGQDLKQSRKVSRRGAAKSAHGSITRGRGVAFRAIDFANAVREFAGSEKEICETTAEFARRTIVGSGRILNIGNGGCGESEANERYEQFLFHRGSTHLNNFFTAKPIAKYF